MLLCYLFVFSRLSSLNLLISYIFRSEQEPETAAVNLPKNRHSFKSGSAKGLRSNTPFLTRTYQLTDTTQNLILVQSNSCLKLIKKRCLHLGNTKYGRDYSGDVDDRTGNRAATTVYDLMIGHSSLGAIKRHLTGQ